jgi:hypothetical protein
VSLLVEFARFGLVCREDELAHPLERVFALWSFGGGLINRDLERLLADTERRVEELERAGVDGFDRSLIRRVEWL